MQTYRQTDRLTDRQTDSGHQGMLPSRPAHAAKVGAALMKLWLSRCYHAINILVSFKIGSRYIRSSRRLTLCRLRADQLRQTVDCLEISAQFVRLSFSWVCVVPRETGDRVRFITERQTLSLFIILQAENKASVPLSLATVECNIYKWSK